MAQLCTNHYAVFAQRFKLDRLGQIGCEPIPNNGCGSSVDNRLQGSRYYNVSAIQIFLLPCRPLRIVL